MPYARACYLICLLFAAPQAIATSYSHGINEDGWRSHSSVFQCRMEQQVPYFGKAVFCKRAGESSSFFIRGQTARFKPGEAMLMSQSPVWRPEMERQKLGVVPVKKGTRPLRLGSKKAELMLAELNRGQELAIVHPSWYEPENYSPVQFKVNSIGFREEYRKYLNCLAGLLPANFDQLKRSAIYFPGGMVDELPAGQMRKLDNILKLVKYDDKIRRFYIDGHTDSEGDRAENLELSKVRAELVKDYLTRRGIPEDWIVNRWHGERYPVASNKTAAGRSKNRRVTVRLEKVEEIEVLPLAANTQ